MRESKVQHDCLVWLNKNGFFAFRVNNGAVYDPVAKCFRKRGAFHLAGVSDAIALDSSGRCYFIEFKSDTGRQSKEQENFAKQIMQRNGRYLLVRSVEELRCKLQECGMTNGSQQKSA